MSNTINSNLLLSSQQQKQREGGKDVLGKDDFMKILMTQLQNQDPLNPMQDKDFIAQMATFSTLEQITNLNKSMEKFINSGAKNNLVNASDLIGRTVYWNNEEELYSTVTSVSQKEGSLWFHLENGEKITEDKILRIE